VWD
jgi:hypothetical protein